MVTQAEPLQLKKRLFNVDEYEKMDEIGILNKDDRVELIKGELIMSHGASERHARYVPRLRTYIRMLNVDEYNQLISAGILSEDERVELIEGEILEMSPIGKHHAGCVNRLNMLLNRRVNQTAIVSVRNPVYLDKHVEVQPDVALLTLRSDFYTESLPMPGDVLLLIEVSDTTLAKDRMGKLPLYARAGVPLVWIVNLPDNVIEVYSDPVLSTYQTFRRAQSGESLLLPVTGDAGLEVDAILGRRLRV